MPPSRLACDEARSWGRREMTSRRRASLARCPPLRAVIGSRQLLSNAACPLLLPRARQRHGRRPHRPPHHILDLLPGTKIYSSTSIFLLATRPSLSSISSPVLLRSQRTAKHHPTNLTFNHPAMSGRLLRWGGLAAAGGVGYYLYTAGGDPKAAQKRAEGQ